MTALLMWLGVLGTGLTAGIFYAFSSFVMKALDGLPAELAAAAMRSINVAVLNASFMLVFFGTGLVCVILLPTAFIAGSGMAAATTIVACCVHLAGCLGVTMYCNVPLNERLAALDAPALADYWPSYMARWTLWNHVRTASAAVACALLGWSLARG